MMRQRNAVSELIKMETRTYTVYDFEELSESAKENALNHVRELILTDGFWSECIIEDAKQIGELIGIDITNVYFSGFSCQGDGAMFEGRYRYKIGALKAIKEYAPNDETLHNIAAALQEIQKDFFYSLDVDIKHSGHYYHEHCTVFTIEDKDGMYVSEKAEQIIPILKDFMRWIYKSLEAQHDFVTSEESIKERIEDNLYMFTESGKID